jgi:hypothetical protein
LVGCNWADTHRAALDLLYGQVCMCTYSATLLDHVVPGLSSSSREFRQTSPVSIVLSRPMCTSPPWSYFAKNVRQCTRFCQMTATRSPLPSCQVHSLFPSKSLLRSPCSGRPLGAHTQEPHLAEVSRCLLSPPTPPPAPPITTVSSPCLLGVRGSRLRERRGSRGAVQANRGLNPAGSGLAACCFVL